MAPSTCPTNRCARLPPPLCKCAGGELRAPRAAAHLLRRPSSTLPTALAVGCTRPRCDPELLPPAAWWWRESWQVKPALELAGALTPRLPASPPQTHAPVCSSRWPRFHAALRASCSGVLHHGGSSRAGLFIVSFSGVVLVARGWFHSLTECISLISESAYTESFSVRDHLPL